ncbi:MAG: hypothetical protein O3C21_02955 [Verrucomicrobia bacterium]|nr:hypothetical protein [Verrucomicrobiota bacterium]
MLSARPTALPTGNVPRTAPGTPAAFALNTIVNESVGGVDARRAAGAVVVDDGGPGWVWQEDGRERQREEDEQEEAGGSAPGRRWLERRFRSVLLVSLLWRGGKAGFRLSVLPIKLGSHAEGRVSVQAEVEAGAEARRADVEKSRSRLNGLLLYLI